MPARVRDSDGRDFWIGTIKKLSSGYVYSNTCFAGSWSHSEDTVGEYQKDNAFLVDRQRLVGGAVNGYVTNPLGRTHQVTNMVPDGIGALYQSPDPRTAFALPDFNVMAPLWVGRMMPLQPTVNLPLAIGESRDIPDLITGIPNLIRDWGRMRFGKNAGKAAKAARLAKEAAHTGGAANLWYRFGASPTVADVGAMLGLLDGFLKSFKDLLELARRGRLKRSLRLPPQRLQIEENNILTHSAGIVTRHRRVRVYVARSWVTTRWKPLIPGYYSSLSIPDMVEKAWQRAVGLSPSGLAVAWWELLPWSWLTDWFANMQRLLGLLGGLDLLLKLDGMCYMRTTWVDTYWHPTSIPAQLEATDAYRYRGVKERIPLQVSVENVGSPSIPAFTGGQLGILGSLVATLR